MSDRDNAIDSSDIIIRILRSDRKSVVGRVLPDSSIEVRAPFAMTNEQINAWLDKFEPEYLPLVAEYRETVSYLAEHPFGYGGEILYRGEWTPIREAEDNNNGYMALMKDGAVVVKPGLKEADMRYHIEWLFSDLAKPILENKLYHYSDVMNVYCKKWTIGNARKRHGSCNSNGKITFSWRIVMMSEAVMDYIVVHELAHLKHFNHSKNFQNEVAVVVPDWKDRRAAYNKFGHILNCCGWT